MKSHLVTLAAVLSSITVFRASSTWEGEAPAEPREQARQEPRPPETRIVVTLQKTPTTDVEPVWHTDWRDAQRLAHDANKPIFAVLVCKH